MVIIGEWLVVRQGEWHRSLQAKEAVFSDRAGLAINLKC
jgi:hypothetical protein